MRWATRPDEMWSTDATRFYTEQDGWCWFFGAIDHCLDDVGRGFGKDIARGLKIRSDWEPQYIADAWR